MPGLVDVTVSARLAELHGRLRLDLPAVSRVAVALYDPGTDLLSTFAHSTEGVSPLAHYEIPLAQVPSLQVLGERHEARVMPDLSVLAGSPAEHSQKLLEKGYRSSYTMPFYDRGTLKGFLFFDACEPAYFGARAQRLLSVFAELMAVDLLRNLEHAGFLRSTLRLLSALSRFRDVETGDHLYRVSQYVRLITRQLPADAGLTDEAYEFVFLFAPAHDIGKIAVPDAILLKPAALTSEEREVMKGHVTAGVSIVDEVIHDMDLEDMPHVALLRNIVRHHHELVDGSGYPDGLREDEIPLEARIVGVADVLDALTSPRPYKAAWSVDRALAHLAAERGRHLDARCVDALLACSDEVPTIASWRGCGPAAGGCVHV